MTLQDDIARPWFQPAVPTGAPQERARPDAGAQDDAGLHNNAGQRRDGAVAATDGGYAGPLSTRVAGELPLDEPRDPVPRTPSAPPMPERVEVTQPYIPAIREHEPSFVKSPNPEAPATAAPAAMPPPPTHTPAPADPPPQVTGPGAVTAPTDLVTAPRKETSAEQAPTRQTPPKRRSLARRAVRKIIGPDLLRKDPVVKKKK